MRRRSAFSNSSERAIWRRTLSAPLSWMLTYVRVRSGVAIRAKLQESRLKERLSFCLRAIAPFRVVKMRRCSLRSSFLGNYRAAHSFSLRVAMAFAIVFFDRGSFAHLI